MRPSPVGSVTIGNAIAVILVVVALLVLMAEQGNGAPAATGAGARVEQATQLPGVELSWLSAGEYGVVIGDSDLPTLIP